MLIDNSVSAIVVHSFSIVHVALFHGHILEVTSCSRYSITSAVGGRTNNDSNFQRELPRCTVCSNKCTHVTYHQSSFIIAQQQRCICSFIVHKELPGLPASSYTEVKWVPWGKMVAMRKWNDRCTAPPPGGGSSWISTMIVLPSLTHTHTSSSSSYDF